MGDSEICVLLDRWGDFKVDWELQTILEEHFEDELQHPVNNPVSPVWWEWRQETVKSLFTVLPLC